ncbi:class I SAM-dependent methyltransferase [Methylotetracoccus oryzae]|uniref:class I SAM-dependent methyltransferase n=1 Tax=Methylotetracoccus oryzae TaxID=1919059 RepID=UPI001118D04A|nr:class I SAM-dependent methyltransferase [Methylotetracoccus oryzae]
MERIPEPDLMDDDDQAEAYHLADFSEPHNHFVTLFGQYFEAGSWQGPVLDLGCGTADVTLRFADVFDAVEIDGIDGAESMLRFGRAAISSRALGHRVRLSRAYLPLDDPPRSEYGAVISNSLLHHLQDPMALWAAIKRVAMPGAPVLVMDLLRPADIGQVEQFVAKYAADAPELLRRDFRNSLRAAYRATEVEAQLQEVGLSRLRVSVASDRHLVVAGRA